MGESHTVSHTVEPVLRIGRAGPGDEELAAVVAVLWALLAGRGGGHRPPPGAVRWRPGHVAVARPAAWGWR